MKLFSLQFSPSHHSNSLACVSVILEDTDSRQITINDGRILQKPNGVLWWGMPTFAIRQPDGSWLHRRSVELDRDLYLKIQAVVLAAYEKWAAAQSQVVRND